MSFFKQLLRIDAVFRPIASIAILFLCLFTPLHAANRRKNVTGTETSVENLSYSIEYKISVQAWNPHGSSVQSSNISFSMPQEGSGDLDVPSTPHSLEEIWANETTGNLTWIWDKKTIGGKEITDYNFTVSYRNILLADAPVDTLQTVTKNNWAIIKLQPRMLYNVWVEVTNLKDMRKSSPSEIINVHAVTKIIGPDAAAPRIYLEPYKPKYHLQDTVTITCNATGDPKPKIQIDTGYKKKFGSGEAQLTVQLNKAMGHQPVTCTAEHDDGGVLRSRLTIDIEFPPKVVTTDEKVNAYEHVTVTLHCTVSGNPAPKVIWCHSQKLKEIDGDCKPIKASDYIWIENTELNQPDTRDATITMRNVSVANSGYYNCEARNYLGIAVTSPKLVVRKLPEPATTEQVSKCCELEGVDPECRSACKYIIDVSIYENKTSCYKELPKMLKCARRMFHASHRDCCISNRVPDRCLKMCDNDESQQDFSLKDCLGYSKTVLNCMTLVQQAVPSPPRSVEIVKKGSRLVEISWDKPERHADQVMSYTVAYRQRGSSDNFVSLTTADEHITLEDLKSEVEYEVHVAALTQSANSDFTSSIFTPSAVKGMDDNSHSRRSTFGSIIIVMACLLLAILLIIGVIWCTRTRRGLPIMFRHKPEGAGATAAQTVAFENPGYDTEAHIRLPGDNSGMEGEERSNHYSNGGSSDWHEADLEPAIVDHKPAQKGLKYTQLT